MSLHNPISPLHAYYVQKVLPAVYDDSLSYYEILCKVQETLNEVVSTTNEQSVVVLEMQQAIYDFIHGGYTDTFEEYLDEWFAENSDAFVQRLIDEGIIPEVADIQSDLETVHGNIDELVASDTSIRNDMVAADTELTTKKVPYPLVGTTPSYGTSGQVLATNADGTTDWQDPVVPSEAQAEQVITQWLNAHPEATTTVQDGAISTAKLANDAVTTTKINDGSVTDEKLAQSGGVLEKIDNLNSVLNVVGNTVGAYREYTSTVTIANSYITVGKTHLAKEHTYKIETSISSAVEYGIYNRICNEADSSVLLTLHLVAGKTINSGFITPDNDIDVEFQTYLPSATATTIKFTVTDMDGLDTVVKHHTVDIDAVSKATFNLNDFYTFKNGGLWNGAFTNYPYLVMCDTIMQFDFDLVLTIKTGFKVGIHSFVNGIFDNDSGWVTGKYTISKGTQFKIVIGRYDEDTSETANIALFTSMVIAQTNYYDTYSKNQDSLINAVLVGDRVINLPTWVQGGIDTSGKDFSSNDDIRSDSIVYLPKGAYWINPNGFNLYYFYYSNTGSFITTCGADRKWGVTSPFRLILPDGKYIRFVQKRAGGLTPSEATLQITQNFPREQLEFSHFKNGITITSKQGEGLGVPPQSLISIKEAFRNLYDGYRINICKTLDGYYVLSHDRSINSVARNPDNTEISTTVNVDEHTLAELNEYDFGIRYGASYAGMSITQLNAAVALCAKLGLKLDIEWKYPIMTQEDAEAIYDTIVTNGYSNKNWHWIARDNTEIGYFKTVCDYVDIEVLVSSGSVDYYLPVINEAMSNNHNVIVGYSDGNYGAASIIKLRKLNIIQNRGTATNLTQLIAQIESGVTELECNFYNPKQALIEYALNN